MECTLVSRLDEEIVAAVSAAWVSLSELALVIKNLISKTCQREPAGLEIYSGVAAAPRSSLMALG